MAPGPSSPQRARRESQDVPRAARWRGTRRRRAKGPQGPPVCRRPASAKLNGCAPAGRSGGRRRRRAPLASARSSAKNSAPHARRERQVRRVPQGSRQADEGYGAAKRAETHAGGQAQTVEGANGKPPSNKSGREGSAEAGAEHVGSNDVTPRRDPQATARSAGTASLTTRSMTCSVVPPGQLPENVVRPLSRRTDLPRDSPRGGPETA